MGDQGGSRRRTSRSGVPWIALVLGLLGCGEGAQPADERPSFVIVVADDLGWNDVGYHGSEIETPNLDRISAEGVRFKSFYAQPTCSATRAALLTGRYPHRYGLHQFVLRVWHRNGLPTSEPTLAERLASAGYETALIGKWHLGFWDPAERPMQRGFQHHYGPYTGRIDYWEKRWKGVLDWHRDGEPVEEPGYATDLLTADAVRWIGERSAERPFLLVLAYTAPHEPLHYPPPPPTPDRYQGLESEERRQYATMVTHLDLSVGRVWDAVRARGLSENTLFVFLSDNGAQTESGGSNRPLRGGKGQAYEGGIRVPAFATMPGVLEPGGVLEAPVSVVDVAPTLLGLAGAVAAEGPALDGVDLWPHLSGDSEPPERELFFQVRPGLSALRSGAWKLVRVERPSNAAATQDSVRFQLFRIDQNVGESVNLVRVHPEQVASLVERLDRWEAQAAPLRNPDHPRRQPESFRLPEVWGAPLGEPASAADESDPDDGTDRP